MSAHARRLDPSGAPVGPPETMIERLRLLRSIIASEGEAISAAASQTSSEAVRAAEMTAQCDGNVVVTGVGKAGLVGQKLVATLASTGNPAHFLHPSEAVHGDLGRVRKTDIVWAISNSGRSEEVNRIAPHLREHSAGLIALTATDNNPLAAAADCVVAFGKHGRSLSERISTYLQHRGHDGGRRRDCDARQQSTPVFATGLRTLSSWWFPGSQAVRRQPDHEAAGRVPSRSVERYRSRDDDRLFQVWATDRCRDVGRCRSPTGRDLHGTVISRDYWKHEDDAALDEPIVARMTRDPTTVTEGASLQEAIAVMSHRRISELPIIDLKGRPVGLVDITDVVSLTDSCDQPMTLPIRKTPLNPLTTACFAQQMSAQSSHDQEIAAAITCIISDVDGVMTDGRIIYDSAGAETKQFHVRDGLGIKLWMACGFQFGILTSRNSEIVQRRAAELGITNVKQGFAEKLPAAESMFTEMGCDPSQVCYIGDDLPDIPVMETSRPGSSSGRRFVGHRCSRRGGS